MKDESNKMLTNYIACISGFRLPASVFRLTKKAEAKERLDYLRDHGESAYAFSFRTPFPPADRYCVPSGF